MSFSVSPWHSRLHCHACIQVSSDGNNQLSAFDSGEKISCHHHIANIATSVAFKLIYTINSMKSHIHKTQVITHIKCSSMIDIRASISYGVRSAHLYFLRSWKLVMPLPLPVTPTWHQAFKLALRKPSAMSQRSTTCMGAFWYWRRQRHGKRIE